MTIHRDAKRLTRPAALLATAVRKLLPTAIKRDIRRAWADMLLQLQVTPDSEIRALLFHVPYYLETNSDLGLWRRIPYCHFMRHGWREGRSPHPLFDIPFYHRQNPQVAASGQDPIEHFLTVGWRTGCNPNRLFDCEFYLQTHRDVAAAGFNPLVHYLRWGAAEERDPGPLFDAKSYDERFSAQLREGLDPLSHYLWRGQASQFALRPSKHLIVPLFPRQLASSRGEMIRAHAMDAAALRSVAIGDGFHR